MSVYVSGNVGSEGARTRVLALVRGFDRAPNGCRASLRDLLDTDREGFYAGALDVLKNPDDSHGCQYLIGLLMSDDLLMRVLCDRQLTRAQATSLARAAARLNPMVEVGLARKLVTLARELAESAGSEESDLQIKNVGRVMEVLSEICCGPRILTSLMRLLRHPNPYLRSKAVKLVGRVGGGGAQWLRGRLAESDPRIRANAVEALWGVDSQEVRELLQMAVHDGNNRVAGNALIALYRLGDNSVIPELLKMTNHGSALFRATAAWAMGETGDPRFTETLAHMLREPTAPVRARAMAALGCMKAAVSRSRQTPRGRVTGLWLECEAGRPTRRLRLSVSPPGGSEHYRVLPTQFFLAEENRHVISYTVTELPLAEVMSVTFILPSLGVPGVSPGVSPWGAGILECHAWKRTSDLWEIQTYSAKQASQTPASGAAPADAELRASANLDAMSVALAAIPQRGDCPEFWTAIRSCAGPNQPEESAGRHLIVFCKSEPEQAADAALVSAVTASGATVQVISAGPNRPVEEFCRAVDADFRMVKDPEKVAEAISMAYLSLLARYEIVYQPAVPESRCLRIRVNTPEVAAETTLPIPA